MNTQHAGLDSMADWSEANTRRFLPIKRMNDLDRMFAPGVITRCEPKKNHRLGALILLVSALTVICLIRWFIS